MIKVGLLIQYSSQKFFLERFNQFLTLKNDFESQNFEMFEEVTSFSEKVLISTRCIRGFMSYSIKKSRKDSSRQQYICGTTTKVALLRRFFVVHHELYLYLIPLKQSKALTVYLTCHTIVQS